MGLTENSSVLIELAVDTFMRSYSSSLVDGGIGVLSSELLPHVPPLVMAVTGVWGNGGELSSSLTTEVSNRLNACKEHSTVCNIDEAFKSMLF